MSESHAKSSTCYATRMLDFARGAGNSASRGSEGNPGAPEAGGCVIPAALRGALNAAAGWLASLKGCAQDWLSGEATRLRAFEQLEPAEPAESQ